MPAWSADLPRKQPETVSDLRRRLGLFSFPHDAPIKESASYRGPLPGWNLRPGGIVEWLAAAPGAGALASALQVGAQPRSARGIVAIVDSTKDCYAPALSGWGISPGQILLVRPNSQLEACWAIEQCLRCPGVSATWAWVEPRLIPARSSPLAAGGGSRRRCGHHLPARDRAARTRLGRLTIAGHASAGRPGRYQTGPDRRPLSPGRSGRNRPGLGDRPCRGCCASGSRGGRSSGCGARSLSLDGRSSSCSPARTSASWSRRAARRPNGSACASVNR